MNIATASTSLLICYLLNSHAAMAIDSPSGPAPALVGMTEPQKVETRSWVDAGAGCLGGAALGTVLPGIGNIIGCVAGGMSVWWMRRSPAR